MAKRKSFHKTRLERGNHSFEKIRNKYCLVKQFFKILLIRKVTKVKSGNLTFTIGKFLSVTQPVPESSFPFVDLCFNLEMPRALLMKKDRYVIFNRVQNFHSRNSKDVKLSDGTYNFIYDTFFDFRNQ